MPLARLPPPVGPPEGRRFSPGCKCPASRLAPVARACCSLILGLKLSPPARIEAATSPPLTPAGAPGQRLPTARLSPLWLGASSPHRGASRRRSTTWSLEPASQRRSVCWSGGVDKRCARRGAHDPHASLLLRVSEAPARRFGILLPARHCRPNWRASAGYCSAPAPSAVEADAACCAQTVFVRATIARTVPCATCAAAATSRCARPTRHARTTACSYSRSASRLRPAARSTRRRSSLPSSSRARLWPSRSASAIDANESQPRLRDSLPRRPVAGGLPRAHHRHRSAPAAAQPRRCDRFQLPRKLHIALLAHSHPGPWIATVQFMTSHHPDGHRLSSTTMHSNYPPARRTDDQPDSSARPTRDAAASLCHDLIPSTSSPDTSSARVNGADSRTSLRPLIGS